MALLVSASLRNGLLFGRYHLFFNLYFLCIVYNQKLLNEALENSSLGIEYGRAGGADDGYEGG